MIQHPWDILSTMYNNFWEKIPRSNREKIFKVEISYIIISRYSEQCVPIFRARIILVFKFSIFEIRHNFTAQTGTEFSRSFREKMSKTRNFVGWYLSVSWVVSANFQVTKPNILKSYSIMNIYVYIVPLSSDTRGTEFSRSFREKLILESIYFTNYYW